METALWNSKIIIASEIAKNYEKEKAVRIASGKKELFCPDNECENKILKYCHGEKKAPYFAHISNCNCDYAYFDSQNDDIMKNMRRTLYEHFISLGYKVKPEVKILPHHYTHLLVELNGGKQIAIEISSHNISANKIDTLTKQYNNLNISVKWIAIDNTNYPIKENQTYFIKRYALNESKNKDLIIVNWDGKTAAQYKVDTTKYLYNGQLLTSINYPETYYEIRTINNLIIENEELTFSGFYQRFEMWHRKKNYAFNRKVDELNEKKRKEKAIRFEQANVIEKQLKQESKNFVKHRPQQYTRENCKPVQNVKPYDKRREEILEIINQQQTQARDSSGIRWVKCEICGLIDTSDKFVSYGGENRINLGICNLCSKIKNKRG